jgi:hypothetical protein
MTFRTTDQAQKQGFASGALIELHVDARPETRVPSLSILTFIGALIIVIGVAADTLIVGSAHFNTFGTYWASGRAVSQGLNPYAAYSSTGRMHFFALGDWQNILDVNLNPPCLLLVFQIMSHLEPRAFQIAWMVASLTLLISAAWLIVSHQPDIPRFHILWLLLQVSIFDTVLSGQIYFALLFLSTVTWILIDKKRDLLPSVALGLLVAIKPIIIFWPVFLFLAGRRGLALRSLGIGAGASALPVLLYGPHVYREWFEALKNDRHWVLPGDIAIPALFARMGLREAGLVLAAALVLTLAWVIWRRKPSVEATSGLALCGMMLCAPLAWHNYVLILAPVFVARRWNKLESVAAILMAVPYGFAIYLLFPINSTARWNAQGATYFIGICLILVSYLRYAVTESYRSLPSVRDANRLFSTQ